MKPEVIGQIARDTISNVLKWVLLVVVPIVTFGLLGWTDRVDLPDCAPFPDRFVTTKGNVLLSAAVILMATGLVLRKLAERSVYPELILIFLGRVLGTGGRTCGFRSAACSRSSRSCRWCCWSLRRSSSDASIGWQPAAVYEHGLAYARSQEFYDTTIFWQWMRFPGDVVFALGALLMAWDFIVKLRPLFPQFIERLLPGSNEAREPTETAAG